jgi:hypothetical protein
MIPDVKLELQKAKSENCYLIEIIEEYTCVGERVRVLVGLGLNRKF